jgi:peptidoglycan/LPS O-acetylase OafA/YrhL
MLYHASLFGLDSPDYWIVRFGWMGVDLFFALSGFLIAGQLLRPFARGLRPNYPRFFARRWLRTVPAYLAVVALYFLVPTMRERPNLQPLWQFLTFTENLFIAPPLPKAFSQVWSLCVEEQFYIAFPAVVALLALRPSPTKVISAAVGVLLFGMALRGFLWLHDVARTPFSVTSTPVSGPFMRLIYWSTWTRLDGLLAGAVAATVRTFRPRVWATLVARPNILLAAGIVGVGVSATFFDGQIVGFLPTVFAFPLLAFSMATIVMAGSESRSVIGRYAIPGAGPLALGAYSLYLSHKPVFHAVHSALSHAPASLQSVGLVIAVLAALVVGAALHWLVERPFLRLRDRPEGPSRSSLAAPPAASIIAR